MSCVYNLKPEDRHCLYCSAACDERMLLVGESSTSVKEAVPAQELGCAGVGVVEEQYDRLRKAAARLAEAVLFDWEDKAQIAREVAKMTTNWEDKK